MSPRTPTAEPAEPSRDFGRDGVTGMLTPDRAMRARDVSRPDPRDLATAEDVVAALIDRSHGRR